MPTSKRKACIITRATWRSSAARFEKFADRARFRNAGDRDPLSTRGADATAGIHLPARFGRRASARTSPRSIMQARRSAARTVACRRAHRRSDAACAGAGASRRCCSSNRRGYAPLTLCRTCGYRFECPNCDAWLVEHRFRAGLFAIIAAIRCRRPLCPRCHEADTLTACGPGVERLAAGSGRPVSRHPHARFVDRSRRTRIERLRGRAR